MMSEITSLVYECLRELDYDINNIHSSIEIDTAVVNMIDEVVQSTQITKTYSNGLDEDILMKWHKTRDI